MPDQSFSVENLRIIFDLENRKGNYLEGKFFPDLEDITNQLKDNAGKLRKLKKAKASLTANTYDSRKEKIFAEKERLKRKKEDLLTSELKKISDNLNRNNFSLKLHKKEEQGKKPIYVLESNPETYFALKQVQYNLRKVYKVQQSNRHNILCQLREVLSDDFSKMLIRTDVSSFYESIPRDELVKKLNEDHLLTISSKKIIKQILYQYGQHEQNETGIPRGVGISAYLAEIYMRKFDSEINANASSIFYARYVDDIVVVYNQASRTAQESALHAIELSAQNHGLFLNERKTKVMQLGKGQQAAFEYLGYKISCRGKKVEITMSSAKLSRYKYRIAKAFDEYKKKSNKSEKAKRKLLKKRMKFLTGNTRLVNNKKNAVVGIYFTNSLLTNLKDLEQLDAYYRNCITSQITNSKLQASLELYTFKMGFERVRFYKFTTIDLREIAKAWKYAS